MLPIDGVGDPLKSMMRQTAYPSHAGLVARLRSIYSCCVVQPPRDLRQFFRGFTHYQHLCNPLVWVRAGTELEALAVGSNTQPLRYSALILDMIYIVKILIKLARRILLHKASIIMKNLMDFCIGTPMFILLGFGLMMGEEVLGGFCGMPTLGVFTNYQNFDWSNFVFNLVFCATAATIV